MKNRAFSYGLSSVVAFSLFTGCGGASNSTESPTNQINNDKVNTVETKNGGGQ